MLTNFEEILDLVQMKDDIRCRNAALQLKKAYSISTQIHIHFCKQTTERFCSKMTGHAEQSACLDINTVSFSPHLSQAYSFFTHRKVS